MLNPNIEDQASKLEHRSTDSTADRILGVMLGAACGGSLAGSSIGLSHKEILATVGISRLRDFESGLSKSSLPDHKPGDLLADTLMGMALAQSLIACQGRLNKANLKLHYSKLLENPQFVNSGPGTPCLRALRDMVDGHELALDPIQAQHASAAARAFVAGCLPGGKNSDEPVQVAITQAQLSQADGQVAAAAAVIADSISFLIRGGKIGTDSEVRNYVLREYELAKAIDIRFAESWDGVAPDLDYANRASELPYSLINVGTDVCELVPTSVGIFLIFRHNMEEAICQAARAGGDTDTVATIVGALSGAYHGFSQLPKRWLDKLSRKDELMAISNGLSNLWLYKATVK